MLLLQSVYLAALKLTSIISCTISACWIIIYHASKSPRSKWLMHVFCLVRLCVALWWTSDLSRVYPASSPMATGVGFPTNLNLIKWVANGWMESSHKFSCESYRGSYHNRAQVHVLVQMQSLKMTRRFMHGLSSSQRILCLVYGWNHVETVWPPSYRCLEKS